MKPLLAILCGCAAIASASPVPAQSRGDDSLGSAWSTQQDEARAGVRQGHNLPLARVLEIIRRQSPGTELDAGLEQRNGRTVYRVRWAAASGQRIDYIVDAQTGAIDSAN